MELIKNNSHYNKLYNIYDNDKKRKEKRKCATATKSKSSLDKLEISVSSPIIQKLKSDNQDKLFHYRRKIELNRKFSNYLQQTSELKEDKQGIYNNIKKSIVSLFFCANSFISNEYGANSKHKYCKNKFCIICSNIRTAKHINRLNKLNINFSDFVFLTLTRKDHHYLEINKILNQDIDFFNSLRVKMHKSKINYDTIRAFETTYNKTTRTAHHHHHIICRKETAEQIKKLWLNKYKDAEPYLQKIKAFNGNYKEILKYITKINFEFPPDFYFQLFKATQNKKAIVFTGIFYNNQDVLIDDDIELNNTKEQEVYNHLSNIETEYFNYDYDLMNFINIKDGSLAIMKEDFFIEEIRKKQPPNKIIKEIFKRL
jgi:hypothetical protein